MNDFSDFPSSFAGEALRPGDPGYAEARAIHNTRHDRRQPALIARCTDADDVATVVDYAVRRDVSIAIRGGGHSVDGSAMPDGALVVDCSPMKRVAVDPEAGLARVEAGVLLGEMDAATQAHGLAVPSGTVSTTGAAGLILGGGIGYLTRRHGMSVDNLVSIELVTVDGRRLTASEDEHPDLFWGMRGAGHNLAIATALTLNAHPVGPDVVSGLLVYPIDQAVAILGGIDAAMAAAPRELAVHPVALPAPPLPGLSAAVVGTPVLGFVVVWVGDPAEADRAIRPVAGLGEPILDTVGPSSWTEANALLDVLAPPGRRQRNRGGYIAGFTEAIAERVVDRVHRAPAPTAPGPSVAIGFPCLGGAGFDTAEGSMAYSREGALWLYEVIGQWDGAERDADFDAWVNGTADALTPHSLRNSYVNLSADVGPTWRRRVYGAPEKWERLRALKAEWDPENRLRHNKNIPPG